LLPVPLRKHANLVLTVLEAEVSFLRSEAHEVDARTQRALFIHTAKKLDKVQLEEWQAEMSAVLVGDEGHDVLDSEDEFVEIGCAADGKGARKVKGKESASIAARSIAAVIPKANHRAHRPFSGGPNASTTSLSSTDLTSRTNSSRPSTPPTSTAVSAATINTIEDSLLASIDDAIRRTQNAIVDASKEVQRLKGTRKGQLETDIKRMETHVVALLAELRGAMRSV
jgi:hypothetical protein